MEEYKRLGHMKLIDWHALRSKFTFFLPHHPILKPDSLTTRLRVVFDASAKTSNGYSLNDILLPGPNLQKDLIHILLRFRMHTYVITADITMMFRQILVANEDCNLQLILWRDFEDALIETYALKTVTYGTSPYVAMRSLRQFTKENKFQYPLAARVLEEDFYMDDLLC